MNDVGPEALTREDGWATRMTCSSGQGSPPRLILPRRAQITEALGALEMNAAASLEAMLAMLRVRDAHSVRSRAPRQPRRRRFRIRWPVASSEPSARPSSERAALLHDLGRPCPSDRPCPSSAWRSSIRSSSAR